MADKSEDKDLITSTHIAIFKGKEIRKLLYNNEWWFSVVDVVAVLTNSVNARDYWFKMKDREKEESNVQLSTICRQLKLEAPDGKLRETDCANTEGIFRIIQSIPSPKAEPFKRWLAKVGYERIQEIEDPELSIKRMRAIYRAKGYSDEWIEKRERGIKARKVLIEEWDKRGVQGESEYAILTAEISKAAFGLTPEEYKKHKGLENPHDNLRDHMTDLELIFTMLGEAATTEIARNKGVHGFKPNKKAAGEGGAVAGHARKDLENRSGRKVVSAINYKKLPENKVRKLLES
ncbi:MAG: Bro-N domain-containing protein [Chitinivibrionales bacterium]|nr:Bro-N domain-containing protein [Chitinivibrionales bacterium]